MKREIKRVENDVLQITVDDSNRWYQKTVENPSGDGAVSTITVPSATWVLQYMPVTEGLLRWYAKHGWDQAREIMLGSADRGSHVHVATDILLDEGGIAHDQTFVDPKSDEEFELTLDEYKAVLSFADWHKYADVTRVVFREKTVWTDQWAGTLDLFCYCQNPQKPPRSRDLAAVPGWNLIDFKTSRYVYDSHKAQVSAYLRALTPLLPGVLGEAAFPQTVQAAILQLAYEQNSRGWKYTAVEDCYDLFQAAYTFWKHDNYNASPKSYELPLRVDLAPAEATATK